MKLRLTIAAAAVSLSISALPALIDAQTVSPSASGSASHGFTRGQASLPSSGLYSNPIAVFRNQIRPPLDSLPVPAGFTRAQLALGDRVFHGEAGNGQCSNCHGVDGAGSPNGTDLRSGFYIWADGTVSGIKQAMMHNMRIAPRMDGDLTPADVDAAAAYVWAIGRKTLPSH